MVMQCGCWQQVALFNGAGSNGDDVSSAAADIIGLLFPDQPTFH